MKETRWLMFVTLPVIVLAVAAFLLMGRSASARAEEALQLLLSCSREEAGQLEALLAVPAPGSAESGLSSPDDGALRAHFSERFGKCMTLECIDRLLANRSVSRSAGLSVQYGGNITVQSLSLTKQDADGTVYRFTASLCADTVSVAQASGTIEMAKVRGGWKAQKITLN